MVNFLQEFPQAQVKLTLDDGPLHFSRDRYDLAVRVGRHAEGCLTARKLIDNDVCLAAAPRLLEKHGHPDHPSKLRRYPTVAYASRDVEIRTWPYVEKGEYLSVEVNPVCWVNDGNGLLDAVRAGLGVGYLSYFAARDDRIDNRTLTRYCSRRSLTNGWNARQVS